MQDVVWHRLLSYVSNKWTKYPNNRLRYYWHSRLKREEGGGGGGGGGEGVAHFLPKIGTHVGHVVVWLSIHLLPSLPSTYLNFILIPTWFSTLAGGQNLVWTSAFSSIVLLAFTTKMAARWIRSMACGSLDQNKLENAFPADNSGWFVKCLTKLWSLK